jgi:hypothetical protein
MKNYFALLFTTALIIHPTMASERPEDVIASFEKMMKRPGIRSASYLANYDEGSTAEDRPLSSQSDPAERVNSNLERASLALGLDRSSIMTREDFLEKNKQFNSTLFHALNAAIFLVSQDLDMAKNDLNFKWTAEHCGIFLEGGQKLPLSDGMYGIYLGSEKDTPNFGFVQIHQLYEIKRQEICFDLSMVWALLVFWKKNIFPNDHFNSYGDNRAHALADQIKDMYTLRERGLQGIPPAFRSTHYAVSVVNVLGKIHDALPQQHRHMVGIETMKKGKKASRDKVAKKIEETKRNVDQWKGKYAEPYKNFIKYGRSVASLLGALGKNPFSIHNRPDLVGEIISMYKKALNAFNFPTPFGPRRLKLIVSPLDFSRLLPGIHDLSSILETDEGDHGSASLPPIPAATATTPVVHPPAVTPPSAAAAAAASSSSSTPSIEDIGVTHEDRATEFSIITPSKESSGEAGVVSDPTDSVISDDSYWQNEHRRHQERKRTHSDAIPAKIVTPYERDLFTFLKESIFHGNKGKFKPRELRLHLTRFKFSMEPNRLGNGSSCTVRPTAENPLFGADQDYFEAFFNVHLPAEGDHIPHDYFSYLKSGFINVFGLTEDYMDERLRLPVPESRRTP